MARPASIWKGTPYLAFAVTLFALTSPAIAQDTDTLAREVLAAPCAACHGPDGHSAGAIPSIAGLDEADLVAKLTAFRDAPPEGTTVMTRHMKGYDDAQIAELAKYFSEAGQ